jgi:hypothetical protein
MGAIRKIPFLATDTVNYTGALKAHSTIVNHRPSPGCRFTIAEPRLIEQRIHQDFI